MRVLAWLFNKQHPTYNRAMPIEPVQERLYTVKEVAELLGVGRQRIYDLIDAGRLNSRKIGRDILISESDLKNIKPGKTRTGRPHKETKN